MAGGAAPCPSPRKRGEGACVALPSSLLLVSFTSALPERPHSVRRARLTPPSYSHTISQWPIGKTLRLWRGRPFAESPGRSLLESQPRPNGIVFISYVRADIGRVRPLVDELAKRFNIFIDLSSFEAGCLLATRDY